MSDGTDVKADSANELMGLQFVVANDYKYVEPDEVAVTLITEVHGNHKILVNTFEGQLRPVSGDAVGADIGVFRVATATLSLNVKGALGLYDQLSAVVKELAERATPGSDDA